MTGIAYELIVSEAAAVLTCGGEVMWTSDNDDEFAEQEDIVIDFDDDEQLDALIDWLVEHEYVPPDVDVEIIEGGEEL
jgi:hypothetical protein